MEGAMLLTGDMIVGAAAVVSALIAIFGIIFAVYRWYLAQNRQDEDIKSLKDEQTLLTYGVLACLKGLSEQGCNGPVSEAIGKIEQHLNERAHE